MLRYLTELGICVGDAVEVLERQPFHGPTTVRFGPNEHVLGVAPVRAMRIQRAWR